MPRAPHTQARRFGVVARWVAALRVLALVLAVQLGGVAEPLMDTVCALTCDTPCHHDDESPLDRPCDDCPPGCPSCHCGNALTSIVPQLTAAEVAALPLEQADSPRFFEQAPPVPDSSPPFRPPQARFASS